MDLNANNKNLHENFKKMSYSNKLTLMFSEESAVWEIKQEKVINRVQSIKETSSSDNLVYWVKIVGWIYKFKHF